jgi:hypothetical protein
LERRKKKRIREEEVDCAEGNRQMVSADMVV